jgi:glucose-1-phosphate cytidylyltransferase
MKAVILAGGLGSRLSEETAVKPKPMVEIGGRPILWHVMKIYSAYGINDFVICCGYRGHMIKEFFSNYFLYNSDVTFDLRANQMQVHHRRAEPWRVTVVDTGEGTMTGGRLKRVSSFLDDEPFCFTYGDGVANVNLKELIAFHRDQKLLATLTAVRPPGRFGAISLTESDPRIRQFREKPQGDGAYVNGGFFVLQPRVIDYIAGDRTVWEAEPLERLAHEGQLTAYRHHGFWQPMDTLRDKRVLEELWASGAAPWKVWSGTNGAAEEISALPRQPGKPGAAAEPAGRSDAERGMQSYESAGNGDGGIPGMPAGADADRARTRRRRR